MIKRLIKLNSHIPSSVVSAAFLITIAGLVSRILGLFRDRLLALNFGAGDALDVYYAAFRVPDLIYNLLILGALSASFIPVFTGLISNEKEGEAWELASGIMNFMIGMIIILSLIFCIFSPYLMRVITPGFSPDKMEQVVLLTRIMFLSPLFLGISGIFGGILTSYKRFLVYSLAPIFYNIGIIFGIIFFVETWGMPGLAWGVVLGAFLHMMIQYFCVRSFGFKHKWDFFTQFRDKNVRKVFRLMIPRFLGVAVNQVNLFVITIFASFLTSGSLAVFSFAQNLQSVPLGIIGISFAIAVFPTLSSFASKNDSDNFVKNFSDTFRQILFLVIPISVFILIFRAQIVRVILGAGEFDWNDTILTAQCLGIFALSLFAQCVIPLLARAFYAIHNTRTPFYIALISEAVNILAIVFLIDEYKILSLAIAFSLASVVQMVLLLLVLRFKYGNLNDKQIVNSVGKTILATFLAGVFAQSFKYLVDGVVNLETFLGVFSQLFISSLVGFFVFILVCEILKIEEYIKFKGSITKRIFKFKKLDIKEDIGEVGGMG